MKNRLTIIRTLLLASLLVSGNAWAVDIGGSVFGGGNEADVGGSVQVTLDGSNVTVNGSVYGGGALANTNISNATGYGTANESVASTATNTTSVTLNDGIVNGDVYGGGLGNNTTAALVYGDVTVIINGAQLVTSVDANSKPIAGRVFGANNINGTPKGHVLVRIKKTASVANQTYDIISVFGGGNLAAYQPVGNTNDYAQVLIQKDNNSDQLIIGSVYGGGNEADVAAGTNVTLISGDVKTGIYGGCNTQGTVSGPIQVNIEGNVGTTGNGNSCNIFGGGYGEDTYTSGNVTVNIGTTGTPVIYGDIYGGSAFGSVNDAAADLTTVSILAGTINGNIFGGGLGDANDASKGQVNGTVTVNIGSTDGQETPTYSGNATINGSVYGCNNTNGSPKANVTVNIYKTARTATAQAGYEPGEGDPAPTYAIANVFGGGKQADYSPTSNDSRATVHVHGCDNTIESLFGGGDAAAAYGVVTIVDGGRFNYVFGGGNGSVTAADIGDGGTNLTVHGGKINNLFGGSNERGVITGPMQTTVDSEGLCAEDMYIAEFFCGNNLAPIGTEQNPTTIIATIGCGTTFGDVYGGCNLANVYGNITLNIVGGHMNTVYGGSKGSNSQAADIHGNVILNIKGGYIGNAFGGSNINGNITGSIQVNVEKDETSECGVSNWHLGNVYGASNLAAYHPTNTSGNYPEVNIKNGSITGDVFGGGLGATAKVYSNPKVTVGDISEGHETYAATVSGNVYGGGSAAMVGDDDQELASINNTTVIIQKSNSSVANVFGGGMAAGVTGATSVTVTNGSISSGVYGGCYTSGTVGGAVAVNINGGTIGTDASHTANVHGGGYGQSTGTSGNVEVTIGSAVNAQTYATIYGDVYGGSALGKVNGTSVNTNLHTYVTLNAGIINGSLYGGALGDLASLNVDENDHSHSDVAANVYAPVAVTVNGGTVTGQVYGCNNVNGAPQSTVVVDVNGTDQPQSGYALAEVYGGGNKAAYSGTPVVAIHNCDNSIGYVFGGGNATDVGGTDVTIWGGNTIGYVFGGGNGAGQGNPGANVGAGGTNVKVRGGTINHVFGGGNILGSISGSILLDINKQTETDHSACEMHIGEVYGGGNQAPSAAGTITIGCTGGSTEGITDLYGGANAANITSGNIVLNITGGSIQRVFGGNNASGSITGSITVNVNWNTVDPCGYNYLGSVFGGGNLAAYSGTATVNITNGTVTHNVYGGGNQADVGATVVTMSGGSVLEGIYGGCNTSGTVGGAVAVNINGGTIGTDASHTANIHGGGYGQSTGTSGNVEVTIGSAVNAQTYATIYGDVYGGSALGKVNGTSVNTNLHTYVTLNAGIINGSLYGGALGDLASLNVDENDHSHSDVAANVYAPVAVTVNGGTVTGQVYGCNNVNGAPQSTVVVDVNGTDQPQSGYALAEVYGGGNKAAYAGTPVVAIHNCDNSIGYVFGGGNATDVYGTDVTIWGGNVIGYVFGGGNGAGQGNPGANVGAGGTNVKVRGGTINHVFGGGNILGAINGAILLDINKQTETNHSACEMHIGEVYGGGNQASSAAGTITIGCTGGSTEGIQYLYGGANDADISGNITLNITDGRIQNIFGGNNTGHSVSGTITVNINEKDNSCSWAIGNVFGGGNQAAYGDSEHNKGNYPVVNILNGVVTGNVYGGGLGSTAIVYGNPQVTIGDATVAYVATVTGDVYGGGDAAAVNGTPVVHVINKSNTSIGNVYGGGNAADVTGTNVTIDGGTIGMVFGGGHGNKDVNPQKVANVTGSSSLTITGGTINQVFATSNSMGAIGTGNNGGTASVTVNKGANSGALKIKELYGGGNEAVGPLGSITIVNTGTLVAPSAGNRIGYQLEGIGTLYGGSRMANNTGNINLNIETGIIDSIFGGNNISGSVAGSIQVTINKAANNDNWYIGNVYGAGNKAAYSGSPAVSIQNGTVSQNVYGGGLGSTARVTGDPQVTLAGGTINGKVFGGGEAAPVTGNPTVTASGANATATRLYGGGLGSTAVVTGNTTVTVSNGTYGFVFGGGEAANQTGNVVVNIQGGTVSNDVYGGGALAHTNTANLNAQTGVITPISNTTTVNLTGGTMTNVYGGGLGDATTEALVYGNVQLNLNNNRASGEKGAVVTDKIFGCNNINGTPKGSVTVHVYATQNSQEDAIGAKNSSFDVVAVYGGGNMAPYIPYTAATATNVIIDGCGLSSIQYVYGGGNAAPVPATDVKIYGSYKLGDVFGGGNGKDAITVNGQSQANPGADVGIHKVDASTWDNTDPDLRYTDNSPNRDKGDDKYILYGSTAGQSIIGTTSVTLFGGNVGNLFGGSNTKGDIIKESKVILGDEDLKTCEFEVEDVYGGSNEAYMSGSSNIKMNCTDGMGEIYGGSRMADVSQNVVLTITGGHYNKVFGGNNMSGRIFGSITINIEQTGCLPIEIEELYGGGNMAPYSVYGYKSTSTTKMIGDQQVTHYDLEDSGDKLYNDPVINIVSCKRIGNVYGGGYQAKMVGSPHININMVKGWTDGHYSGKNDGVQDDHSMYKETIYKFDEIGSIGNVFGGGNEAEVVGNTYVNIGTESSVTVHNVTKSIYNEIKNAQDGITDPGFTQSDGDDVTKNLTITVKGVNITGNVYGGGNQSDVTGSTNVQIGKE